MKDITERLRDGLTSGPNTIRTPWGKTLDEAIAEIEVLRLQRNALEESVKLQSHYAQLLNMYDGGKRLTFSDADAWIKRLASLNSRAGAEPMTVTTVHGGDDVGRTAGSNPATGANAAHATTTAPAKE